ncbi:MAG: ABC transporter ATP-binding protein [Lachnospiraceae bacterium]|nr:ABC transporter ATP-binding protein [Lachnospiraceae bacterium]
MNLSTENIRLSYGAQEILKGVSINGNTGEFIGIIGPNGSGKSTLLKCIYRILKPHAGQVFLDGEELSGISIRNSAKKMAVVAQHNYYNFDFSVMEVVLMGRAPHKKTMERDNAKDFQIAQKALETVEMEGFANRSFSTLSGGEQQRVILARALAQQTPCLILDEPTNHLDITHQIQLMKIVKNLEVTVISAVHDLNIAAMFCDRLYVLQDGEIVGQGTPQEVLTAEFIKKIYRVETEIVYDSAGQLHVLFQK